MSSRGRTRQLTKRVKESFETGQFDINLFSFQSTFESVHDQELDMQERMRHPMAFHSEMLGDTMYFHQAMNQPDADSFVKATIKEVNGHVDNGNWELTPKEEVPSEAELLPAVWAMIRKRDLVTNEITKYKARLNIHGGKQTLGVSYWETYASVVTWFAIRLLIICGVVMNWNMRRIDFVMAYCQAPIETDIYLKMPVGLEVKGSSADTHVLKLINNVYGGKQAGKVWNDYLTYKLEFELGYQRSIIDECVYYKGDLVLLFVC